MEFAFTQASITAGAAMVTKKGVIDLLQRTLPENLWKTHLLNRSGKRLQIRDVSVRAIIQAITTESIKTDSQYTQDALDKRQQAPVWSDGIRLYISNLPKNEHELTKIGFSTDYSLLVHRVKYQLESFAQTPQGKTFVKVINEWDKEHKYGTIYLKEHFDDLTIRITNVGDDRRRAPGYNKANDIADGKDITHDKDSQSMFEQGFFSSVDAAPDYPPSKIDTTANATDTSNDATVTTIIQTTVNSALEARDAADKNKQRRDTSTPANPTPSNPKQMCRHCNKADQMSIHTGIAEEKCFLNPSAIKYRPHWTRNKLEEKGIAFRIL